MEFRIVKGDITKVRVDAIVNAANSSLLGGSGVDGAIHRAAGPALLEECRRIRDRQGSCKTGEVVVTGAGNLPAKFVIHAVGPVWNDGNRNEVRLLESCYLKSAVEAERRGLKSIAYPNISTGIYRFPKGLAAETVSRALRKHFEDFPRSSIEEVVFVCFEEEDLALYQGIWNGPKPPD